MTTILPGKVVHNVKRVLSLILFVVVAVAVLAVAGNTATRTQAAPGSFISSRTDSVKALVDQISADKNVAKLYEKHYGMSASQIADYFEKNLTLITLKSPLKTQVYYVSKSGTIKLKQKLLPAGTRVFATKDGTPVLEWRCGNPFSKYLPKIEEKQITSPVSSIVEEPEVKVAADPPMEAIVVPPPVASVTTSVAPTVTPTIVPVVESAPSPPMSLPPALLWAVPALIGAVSVKNAPPAVPEPASVAAMGLALSGTALAWCRRRYLGRSK